MTFSPASKSMIRALSKSAAHDLGQYLQRRRRVILRHARSKLGLSQEKLAQILTEHGCACCRNSIAGWENPNGPDVPSLVADAAEALLIARGLELTGT